MNAEAVPARHDWALIVRRTLATITPSRGLSRCSHCRTPWGRGNRTEHIVRYDGTAGLFVVCEFCWPRLSVDERVEYAYRFLLRWRGWPITEKWPAIERAYREAA